MPEQTIPLLLKSLLLLFSVASFTIYASPELTCPQPDYSKDLLHQRSSDFSSLDDWGRHFSYPHSAQLVSDPVNPSNTSLRMTLHQGDVYTTRSGEHFRAEVYERYRAQFEQPMYYRFKVLIPDEWEFADVRALIAQWHATPDRHLGEISRSPNLGIELRNDRFLIRSQTSKLPINEHNKEGMTRIQHFVSKTVKRNHWYTFEIQVNWTHQDTGFLRVAINGKKVVDYQGETSYHDCLGPYFKMGIYRDDTPNTFQIYFDDYQRKPLMKR
ncbi:polysaccharide lyase [Photobacterium sp. ZSDE20]|uniref:Polysaccharide lyase n=1 Tax=Photobacterium pectinilyticum TaxID=2906793 RepID=A0ABT1N4K9_9GAMM|nr:polysaccharide lyase [Photobacterium sp. ZSDE20]MCQ1059685.1 polysaccharide lyase [Photobacterium sp. ZSDE20]MDD1825852.1 polysaccharide lyase [Photobacterium sp. ZSDE20]